MAVTPTLARLALSFLLIAATLAAQPPARRGTTILALRSYAGFYHQQVVSVVGTMKGTPERASIGTDEGSIGLLLRDVPEGTVEARGQFLDIGRMSQDDPRLIPFNLLDRVRAAYPDRWPRPGEELVLIASGTAPPPAATDITQPPLRSLAMQPEKFVGRRVTVIGQFRGRNLFGDLPESPINDKWEFVIRSADAAVWVTGLQPKGKTFTFDAGKRLDAGRWVKISGTARTAKGLTWIEGTSIELAQAPSEAAGLVDVPAPALPPLEVLFSAPTDGEGDVGLTTRIRLQLSRDLNPATLKDRIRITYTRSPELPPVQFVATYTAAIRALEIRPSQPWDQFSDVKVEFLEGITGTDGSAMKPFALSFTTGGPLYF